MEEARAEGSPPAGAVDSEAQKGNADSRVQPRGKWANKTEFLLSMAGEIIGLGNVWRFPYLCFRNGGGVFFIPYFVFLFFCGVPIFFLETALGQFTSQGGVTAWRKICPMFEGVGIASQVIVMYLNIYYIVILAWALFYLFNSFKNPLPWSTCDNYWNTVRCHHSQPEANWSFLYNETSNVEYDYELDYNSSAVLNIKSPEEEYFVHRVLRVSDDMFAFSIHWDLALCLLLAWIVCYFCIWKGVKSTGKVVYFTATFPYLMLLILLIRGLTLPGAWDGIKYYLYPDLGRITDPRVWRDAGTQVFFSYAVCQGVLTALGSYNKYNNDCYKDCIALCALNSCTSIVAGFAVFSVLGFMARQLNVDIAEVASSGPGLAFIAYPKALSMLPGSQFWSVLFFLMILFLGLDSQFVCVESLATAITDMFPGFLQRPRRREYLVLVIALVCFLLGLPLVSEGGIVLFTLIDTYGPSGTSLLFIACFETIVIAWVYGADRFYDNIYDMIGYKPFPVLKYCWLFITPLICWITLTYDLHNSNLRHFIIYGYEPGVWSEVFGSLLIITPLMCIPAFILRSLCRNSDQMTKASKDLHQRFPHEPKLSLCGHVVFPGQSKPTRADRETNEKPVIEDTTGV